MDPTPQQRARNPWGQGERLRGEILEAAARLLSELGGEEGLTIRGVARAAGIAPASIYQHFADKNALVHGLIEYDYERLAAAMAEADAALPAEQVVDRVRAQMHAYCQFALDSPGHYRLMLNNRPRREPGEPPKGPLGKVILGVTAAFERCEQAGHKLRLPAERSAVMVFVATHGLVALWHASPDERQLDRIEPMVSEFLSLVFA
ncbi:TetR/AcrR family transcriptional regulator [Kutzneria viridogrisea]|uniref:HTH tetR-type domain-containing protein n=2 Tax=Kutzneria TaxID=43356 RepID=W5W486_9PSEU|nr:TetR/AcrR family transcriptional regulator [Kutzneria albida]AHH95637.1 hypothetical protein KALB_2268 [Kutzneria albida DSM 43870]MBA8927000.1 AcrR family transcriptional regulator [Kutzneria viridogrisea]